MKSWKVTYTEDNGLTYKTMTTEAETYSKAYINVLLKISKEGMVTEVTEI
jgi:hypothetical protein